MAAEIRVDTIKSRSGINTLSFTGSDGFTFTTNTGIGTTNPTSKLHVDGTALITGVSTFRGDVHITGFNSVGIGTDIPNNDLTVSDTIQPSYAPSAGGEYIEIARSSGGDAGFLINKNTGQWLIGIDNSDGANAPLRFEYGAAGSAHPGLGAGTLGMIVKHDGDVGIGTDNPSAAVTSANTAKLAVGIVSAYQLYGDGSNLTGIAAGGSGTFDTGITTSIIVPVTAGIGTNDDTNRDIFVGPGIGYSFPSTASTQYVIESIHVVNKSGGNLYLSGRHDINGGANVPIANRVAVPYNGAVELLEQPHVANLSDIIRLQALTGTGTSATGANNGLDAFITYSAKSDSTDYIGVAQTITSTDQEFFEVASNPCVVQSLNLVNYSNNVDVDVSISIFSGGTTGGIATTGIRRGYLAYNITVPRNSTIELCEKPKRLESNQALLISASSNNQVGVLLSGKYITS